MTKRFFAGSVLLSALLFVSPALAHHSFSMFDRNKEIEVKGTVIEFQLVNPHAWLWLAVPEADGQTGRWGFEGEAVSVWARKGIRKSSLQPGEHVTVRAYPVKDGSKSGFVLLITKADGRKLDPTNGAPDVGADRD